MKCKHGNIVKFHSMVKCARNETKSPGVSALFFHCFSLSLCVRRWDAEANLHNRQIHWVYSRSYRTDCVVQATKAETPNA